MKKIELRTSVIYTLVDDEDYETFSPHKWSFSGGYAVRNVGKVKQFLHRVIMNCPDGMVVDHIDNNRLNNQKSNLRICTQEENSRNVGLRSNNVSGFIGIYYKKERKKRKWCAKTRYKSIDYCLGYYDTPEEAAKAYDLFVESKSSHSKTNKGLGLL